MNDQFSPVSESDPALTFAVPAYDAQSGQVPQVPWIRNDLARQGGSASGSLAPVPTEARERRQPPSLPKWRLKRVADYVEAHLGERVTLHDLAGAAGLTRMYFAAQFRLAKGMRPHEYLLQRRIGRAQEMLCAPNARIADVAVCVGFSTQAHFTTVFKRIVGQTPYRWQRSQVHAERNTASRSRG